MAVETHQATVEVCKLGELEKDRTKVVSSQGRTILLILDQGTVYALDNRCPHMGFPLQRGSIQDGILTCHWHHAKFDLAGGCTLDPFADDVPSFVAEVRDGAVFVGPQQESRSPGEHWLAKLQEGLEQNIRLVMAKSVIGLSEAGEARSILEAATRFGIENRDAGWSSGLSILTAMANVRPQLRDEDQRRALYHGVVQVARSTADERPNFDLDALATSERRPERYIEWFRRFVDSRSADAAERTLKTAIDIGLANEDVATMIFAACSDHLYLDEGHALDFANKAFELLDHIGWDYADAVLPSLVPMLVSASRMEESSSWRHPVDLTAILASAFEDLESIIESGSRPASEWTGHRELGELILDGEPQAIVDELCRLIGLGVPLTELSASIAYAAARRPVHFHTSNEFSDWDTVHHTFTYTNAVDQALKRAPSALAARGLFDGAMSVYLERFLNIPKQPLPQADGSDASAEDLLAAFDLQGQEDETAQIIVNMLAADKRIEVVETLGRALLREDAGFHQFQIYEAGLRQYQHFAGTREGDDILIGVGRFLSAHAPTVRSTGQTFEIAARLQRGEALHAGE